MIFIPKINKYDTRSMNDDEFNKLYQKTGTYFLHSSYALLQLRSALSIAKQRGVSLEQVFNG